MSGDLHHLAAAYALDALTPDERAGFEDHLRDCDVCRADVDDFRETAGRLAGASAVAPPSALRADVLAEIGRTPQDPPAESVDELAVARRRRRPVPLLLASAAAVALVVVGAAIGLRGGTSGVDDVLAAADAVVTPLDLTPDGEAGTFRVVWSPGQDRVAVIGDGLPDPGADRVYELWAIVDGTPVPAGLFEVDDGAVRDVADIDDVDPVAWGVTIEPAAGSEAPTTPIVFFAEA